jgi:uncharacterized membrane protein HdeD (DUF308 family)
MDFRSLGAEALRRGSWWYFVVGIALVVLGVLALGVTGLVTLTTVFVLGFVLIVGGIALTVSAIVNRHAPGAAWEVLIGILYAVVGVIMIRDPAAGAASLTLVIAAYLLAVGVARAVEAIMLRLPHWGWQLLSGIVSVILGLSILAYWPSSSLTLIGTFVGIDMIFNGWADVMLGVTMHEFAERAVS